MLFLTIKGIIAIAEKVNELIENRHSEGAIKSELLDLQRKLDMNEISMEEYDKKEEALLKMLDEIKKPE